MSTEADQKRDGPSKNELKKLAKKAAKAEKKAEKQNALVKKKQDPPPATTTNTPPPLCLANADSSPNSIKAVWASMLYDIKVKYINSTKSEVSHGPFLTQNDIQVMGGNAMAKALGYMGVGVLDHEIDEWCEWERASLRTKKDTTKLQAALESHNPIHLVGNSMSVADICILTTLYVLEEEGGVQLAPSVQAFCDAHRAAYRAAQNALQAVASSTKPIDVDNPSLIHVLEQIFGQAIFQQFGKVELPTHYINKTQNPKHGDYQCSAAMPIFSLLKKSGALPAHVEKPQHVAQLVVDAVSCDANNNVVLQELSIQGPGFITCRISSKYLQLHINNILKTGGLPKPAVQPTTCVVDFSSPNIAKEMHVGHLRSTIIGESVCRLLEFVGHNVERINHVGDWGTQFGMLIQYLREEYPDFHSQKPNISDLTLFYKSAKTRFDESAEFKKASQQNVVKLQSGQDEEATEIWNLLCNVSRKEFQKVYDRLDITVTECGESFYNDKIPPVIKEFEDHNLISIEEGGAKCVFVEGFNIPLMLQKSDGGYGYDSTDMAALKHRLQTLKAKRIICITDFSQANHFSMCFQAAKDIGWLTENQKLEHIGFGTVQGEDGKRFQTRSGDTVRLVDLLDEAASRMEASLRERIAENRANISLDEVHDVAEAMGYGAVKYFDLRRNPTSNYKFSYDQMLDTRGNTAVYLLYAHARLESICTKAKADHGVDVNELIKSEKSITIAHGSERNLALQLQGFADTIEATMEDLFPYHVSDYLYNTAIAASDFVTQCKVLGSPEMESRLLLCRATAVAMRQCFDLLGIRHVMRL